HRISLVEGYGLDASGGLLIDVDGRAVGILGADGDRVRARGLHEARIVPAVPGQAHRAGGALAEVEGAHHATGLVEELDGRGRARSVERERDVYGIAGSIRGDQRAAHGRLLAHEPDDFRVLQTAEIVGL